MEVDPRISQHKSVLCLKSCNTLSKKRTLNAILKHMCTESSVEFKN